MTNPRKQLYYSRFIKHVIDTQKHIEEGDFIQASEKVWGAMSSLVNSEAIVEKTGVNEKKEAFIDLFRRLSVQNKQLKQVLIKARFKDSRDFATIAQGLHLYFFGGRSYPEEYIKNMIQNCYTVLEEVKNILGS